MPPYIGSGPYCYANSLAMLLGGGVAPADIEVLTGSPYGFELIGGRLPFFDPYGWDPDQGLDDAIGLLGWTCRRQGAEDGEQAVAQLREAVKAGLVLAGPVEFGLLRHMPGMTGPIESDHFVVVLDVDDDLVRFHDPHGHPYATLPVPHFLEAWKAETIAYRTTDYTMRDAFQRVRSVSVEEALRASLPGAVAWLRGRDLPVPPGTVGGASGVDAFADQVEAGLDEGIVMHLVHFAVRVGTRRMSDASTALSRLGLAGAAAVADEQARLIGSLQYDFVAGESVRAATTLRRLAPTYASLAAALTG